MVEHLPHKEHMCQFDSDRAYCSIPLVWSGVFIFNEVTQVQILYRILYGISEIRTRITGLWDSCFNYLNYYTRFFLFSCFSCRNR